MLSTMVSFYADRTFCRKTYISPLIGKRFSNRPQRFEPTLVNLLTRHTQVGRLLPFPQGGVVCERPIHTKPQKTLDLSMVIGG
jgi:hypothetical protein